MVSLNGLFPEFHPEWRITETFSDTQVLGQVFSTEEIVVVSKLLSDISMNLKIKAGDRRIRELLGCKTYDLAGEVSYDANNMTDLIDMVWLRPIIPILRQYPDVLKSKPDADIFVWNADLELIEQQVESRGLRTNKMTGTGNVDILEIVGANGSATLIDGDESWRTQDWWPKYDVKGLVATEEGKTVFKVDCAWDSMYTYPLELPGIHLFEDNDPRKVVVVGRAMLWQALSTDPMGHRLREPSLNTQREVVKTVAGFSNLLKMVEADPRLIKQYASGIRDMSLALRVFVLNEPQTDYQRNIVGTFLENNR